MEHNCVIIMPQKNKMYGRLRYATDYSYKRFERYDEIVGDV